MRVGAEDQSLLVHRRGHRFLRPSGSASTTVTRVLPQSRSQPHCSRQLSVVFWLVPWSRRTINGILDLKKTALLDDSMSMSLLYQKHMDPIMQTRPVQGQEATTTWLHEFPSTSASPTKQEEQRYQ